MVSEREARTKYAAGPSEPAGTILLAVIHIDGVRPSILHENGCPQGVLNDSDLLIIIEFCCYDETRRIIDEGRQINLFLGAISPNGKVRSIFDIALKQHTAL